MSPSAVTPLAARRTAAATDTKANCALCASRHRCWGERNDYTYDCGELEFARRKIKRGTVLYRMGDTFENLYAVRSGFFKTSVLLEDGREQVTAFKMMGDLLGLDGIGGEQHMSDAVALEDSEVCVIPYEYVSGLWRRMPGLAHGFTRTLSREIANDQSVIALLGTMQAQERVAVFLLNLAQRFKARGYSGTEFLLRMRREEIGSYLGLKLETVSRILSRLQAQGLIEIQHNRNVLLKDIDALRAQTTPTPPAVLPQRTVLGWQTRVAA